MPVAVQRIGAGAAGPGKAGAAGHAGLSGMEERRQPVGIGGGGARAHEPGGGCSAPGDLVRVMGDGAQGVGQSLGPAALGQVPAAGGGHFGETSRGLHDHGPAAGKLFGQRQRRAFGVGLAQVEKNSSSLKNS